MKLKNQSFQGFEPIEINTGVILDSMLFLMFDRSMIDCKVNIKREGIPELRTFIYKERFIFYMN